MRKRLHLVFVLLVATLGLLALMWPSSGRSLPAPHGRSSGVQPRTHPELLGYPTQVVASKDADLSAVEDATKRKASTSSAESLKAEITVIDEASGLPVDGARVFLAPHASSHSVTDIEGIASIEVASSGQALGVVAIGYLPAKSELGAGEQQLTVRLKRGEQVSGIVIDDLGEPIEGVRIWCSQSHHTATWPHPTTYFATDVNGGIGISRSNGEFTVDGLAADYDYEIAWSKHMWTRSMRRPYPVRAGDGTRVVLKMRPIARVLFNFVDRQDGHVVTTQSIETTCGPGIGVGGWPVPYEHSEPPLNLMGEARAAEHFYVRDGTSDIDDNMQGTVTVLVKALGYRERKKNVTFKLGQRQTIRIPLDRKSNVELGNVAFTVTLGNRPYTGRLSTYFRGASGSTSSSFMFREGKQINKVRIPSGRYEVSVKPVGLIGASLEREDVGVIDIQTGMTTNQSLNIPCCSATLDVRDRDGKRVLGYDVGVAINGRAKGGGEMWDFRARASSVPGLIRNGLPVLYFPMTGDVVLSVNKFGVGSHLGTIAHDSNTMHGNMKVFLNQPARDTRRAARQE